MRPPELRVKRLRGRGRWLRQALELHSRLLGPLSLKLFRRRLRGRPRPLLLVALARDRVVGYKFGYEDRHWRFYSWIGGVDPEFRRRGVGRALMRCQHRLLKAAGYRVVRTETKNKHRAMLLLDIRSGFDVIGTYTDRHGEAKIILEKRL